MTDRYKVRSRGTHAELLIYGDIGEDWWSDESNDAKTVIDKLEQLEGHLDVRINSYGGTVSDGLAIFNAIRRRKSQTTVHIDGVAYSIASLIAMAGDEVRMAENALMMIHAPWSVSQGNSKAMREMADALDKYADAMTPCYLRDGGPDEATIKDWLADGKDHYFTSAEAIELGLADSTSEESDISDIAAALRNETRFRQPAAARRSTPTEEMAKQQQFGAGVSDPQPKPEGSADPAPTPAPHPPEPSINAEEIRREAKKQERARAQAIRAECRRLNLDDSVAERLVDSDQTLEQCRGEIIDAIAERDSTPPTQPRVEAGTDERQKVRSAVEQALLHRVAPGNYELTEDARDFRGLSLMEITRALLERSGRHTRGMSRMKVAAQGLNSTSDFPFILENLANKRLRDGYTARGRTWGPIARQSNLPDFKEVSRVQLGEAPKLEALNELGEFQSGTMGEGKETWALATYGKIVGFSRQAIINDDLSAFDRVVTAQGTQARLLEDDIVWLLITAPHTMADGNDIFTGRNNTVASNPLSSVANLGKARTKLKKQKGFDGKTPLNLTPRHLLVPTDLETAALQYTRSTMVADSSGNINPWAGTLDVIPEPRLDGSPAQWYVAADPGEVDMIEWGYLEGEEGPQFDMEEGFKTDGVEYKVRLDFGATVLDYRGFVRSAG